MRCIGTAGHVDHGKSALVTALTGIDPDRLAEEKARGMTIDLGFAWLTLPSGREASIIDVPGHEDFINNMLAGVSGIDAALLVVAADEGVMPQTREHLAILDLLRVHTGVVALTKCDLVDDEWLELVREEVSEQLKPTTLADASIIPCSALTGVGLPELLQALDAALAADPGRSDKGLPRLPIDRVFAITGFGTVVTGTLQDGRLRVGQEVQLYPGILHTRIRGLQVHKQAIAEGTPGVRLAVNLVGVAKSAITRGDVLALPESMRATTALDVRIEVLADLPRPIVHNSELDLYTGAAETLARVLLLDAQQLQPGESGWAQLRLRHPMALVRGDRFILRAPSPGMTVGGGVVIEPWARRHRRHDALVLTRLEQLARGNPEEIVLAALHPQVRTRKSNKEQADYGNYGGGELQAIARATEVPLDEVMAACTALVARGAVQEVGSYRYTSAEWERLAAAAKRVLATYHQQYPLRRGMPREEWRAQLTLTPREAGEVIAVLLAMGALTEATAGAGMYGAFLKLPEHAPRMTPQQKKAAAAMLEQFRRDQFNPPTRPEVEQALGAELTMALLEQGKLLRVSETILLDHEAYAQAIRLIVGYLNEQGTITVAQARDLLGTSRKYMLAFLEHLDERHITRRRGDDRVLGVNASTAAGL